MTNQIAQKPIANKQYILVIPYSRVLRSDWIICNAKPHCTGRRAYNYVVQAMLQSYKNPLLSERAMCSLSQVKSV